jgi:predicted DNA-binding transcriptional regulator AlpA
MQTPKLVGYEYVAAALNKAPSTVRIDMTRRPESLPPRARIPGRKVQWFESDVIEWMESFMNKPAKRGRPSTLERV